MRVTSTEQFILTIGLVPGYDWQEDGPGLGLRAVIRQWHKLMTEEGDRSGVYPSAVFHPGAAVYRNEADGRGEPIAVAFGTRNPKYAADPDAWRLAVIRVAEGLKAAARQVTCQVAFSEVRMVYFEEGD